MKLLFVALALFTTLQVFGQNEKPCMVIQFLHEDSLLSKPNLTTSYQPAGFYLVPNGVYDFIIDGKKYFQAILLAVDNKGFSISTNWETNGKTEIVKDTLSFLIDQKIQLRMISMDDGVGGLPVKTKNYIVSVTFNDDYCNFGPIEISEKGNKVLGHVYFTAAGLKAIKIVDGKAYLCEKGKEYALRRK